MLPVWQGGTLHRRLSGGDRGQEQLQAPLKAQAQVQEEASAEIKKGWQLWQEEGLSDGGASGINYSSGYSTSSSSSSDKDDNMRKNKKVSKNFNGLSCFA